jgi:adenosylcobinamide-GDP ribazoletransferase
MPSEKHPINKPSYWQLFCASLQFITRIPVPQRYTENMAIEDYPKGVITFPLVGAVIGGLSAFVFLVTQLWWGNLIAAVCAVICGAMVTGAFHLDGLADTADGIFSSRSREKMLEIMRDSRIGSNGALALIFVVMLKVLAIYQLAEKDLSVVALLIASPALARTLSVALLMYRQKYARDSGLGHFYIGNISQRQMRITLWTGLALVLVLAGFKGLLYAAATAGFALLYRTLIENKIGGQTGDTLGAGKELFELIFLLLMLA